MLSRIANEALGLLGLCLFAGGFLLMHQAGRFSIIERQEWFLDTPTPIVMVATIAATACGLLLLIAFFDTPLQKSRGETLAMCLLVTCPLLMCFTQLGIILNGKWDTTSPRAYYTQIVNKRVNHPRRGGPVWLVYIQDWRNPSSTMVLRVSEAHYRAASRGAPVEVRTKKGYFGFEWLVSYRIDRPVSIRSEHQDYLTPNGGLMRSRDGQPGSLVWSRLSCRSPGCT